MALPHRKYPTVHQTLGNAVSAALQTTRPGVLAKDVDATARKVIERAGYGEYFVNRLGHRVGNEEHEQPYLSATSNNFLEEEMVFSIGPAIYLPEKFGVRLENIIILTADGAEILSELPDDLFVIN